MYDRQSSSFAKKVKKNGHGKFNWGNESLMNREQALNWDEQENDAEFFYDEVENKSPKVLERTEIEKPLKKASFNLTEEEFPSLS